MYCLFRMLADCLILLDAGFMETVTRKLMDLLQAMTALPYSQYNLSYALLTFYYVHYVYKKVNFFALHLQHISYNPKLT